MKLTAWEHFPYPVRKAWRVMRITTLLILVISLHLSAKTTAQKITLNSNDISIEQFFKQLKKQTGYSFLLENGVISKDEKISVNVKDVTLETVLDQILKPINLSYKIENKIVYVQKMIVTESILKISETQPPGNIHGRVTDSLGNPLSGASIYVKGTRKGTQSDVKGNFILKNVPINAILTVSYTGYVPREIKTAGEVDITISLIRSTNQLDQVVVIPYGTTTQRLNTGDIGTVTAKVIEEQPISNPLAALEGRVPGLVITQNTGVPGGSFNVQIRGQNSLTNGNDPFYVIDGVPYNSEIPGSSQGMGPLASSLKGGSPLNFINPYEIESIEILKDADATAIYGSRAANGAILITTKKGKPGRTAVDLNIYSGLGEIPHTLDLMNTQQYLTMRHEAFQNDGDTPSPYSDFDLTFWDTTRYTNWQKVLLGNKSHYDDAQLSVSGGSANTQFLIGGGYHRETTPFPVVLPGQGADQKASMHFTINNKSENGKFRISFTGSFLSDKNTVQPNDFLGTALYLPPDAPPLYNSDGSLNWAPISSGGAATWQNPLSTLLIGYNSLTSNLISNAVVTYTILPGLDLKADLGYTNTQTDETITQPTTVYDPSRHVTSGYAFFNELNTHSWIIEPQANYKTNLGKGIFTALLGTTFHENIASVQQLLATGFSSDAVLENIQAATSISALFTSNTQYKYNAVFGRLNYVWDDKYLLNLTGRRDGSSRFGPGKQFANFGAIGAGWIFTRKNLCSLFFLSSVLGSLERVTELQGSDQVGDYRFLDLYSTTQYPYQNLQGFYPANLYNPNLAWEENKKLEGGIELGLLKERIHLTASIYRNRSDNQLVSTPVSGLTGFSSIPSNLPAVVQNLGWEFTLNSVNIKTNNFSWLSYFNLAINQNKLISYPNLANSPYSQQFVIGQPINIVKVVKSLGVNDSSGIYQFADVKGNPTYNPNLPADQTGLINTSPKYYGGLGNTVVYKSLSIDFFFQFVKQMGQSFFATYSPQPGTMNNQPVAVLNRWQKPGDEKPYQQFSQDFSSNASNSQFNAQYYSNQAYSDASFIRLKNVAVSWQFPVAVKQKLHVQNLRLYFQGQNLLTITNFKGIDPESQGTILPPMRVYTFGIQATL